MTTQETRNRGEELNQLSRLMFDRAALLWAVGLGLEALAGVLGIAVGLTELPADWKLISAIVVAGIVAIAYAMRIRFADDYDDAETMRRQSVLAEALEWPIGATEFSHWREKAGSKVLRAFRLKPRDADYYATAAPVGPKRLLGMTIESAFYTRHVYRRARTFLWILAGFIGLVFVLILSFAPLTAIPSATRLEVIYILYLALPLLISVDIIGRTLKLQRLVVAIQQIEQDLERLDTEENPDLSQVMRLVSEYNCQVVAGFPVLNCVFRLWHDEIRDLWNRR